MTRMGRLSTYPVSSVKKTAVEVSSPLSRNSRATGAAREAPDMPATRMAIAEGGRIDSSPGGRRAPIFLKAPVALR